jgi:hypothetical protein
LGAWLSKSSNRIGPTVVCKVAKVTGVLPSVDCRRPP